MILNFAGYGFNSKTFFPKYNIIPNGSATNMFFAWNQNGFQKINLKSRLEECGVILDTSKATNLNAAFGYTDFTEVPTVDFTGTTASASGTFYNSPYLKKIEKIITKESVTYGRWFENDTALEEVSFEGIIGNVIDFSYCPLTKTSIENIIEHLSTTSSGKTLTLKQSAVNAVFTTEEFEALKATRTNWTFALA